MVTSLEAEAWFGDECSLSDLPLNLSLGFILGKAFAIAGLYIFGSLTIRTKNERL